MSDSTTLVQYDLRASYRRRSTVSCLRHYELGTVSSSTSSTCLQFVSRGMSCTHTHIRGVRTKVIPHVRLRGRAFVAFDKIRRVGFCQVWRVLVGETYTKWLPRFPGEGYTATCYTVCLQGPEAEPHGPHGHANRAPAVHGTLHRGTCLAHRRRSSVLRVVCGLPDSS
jgi:hypothetical protein